jgi:hypothetical protein
MLGSRKVAVLGGDKFRDEYSLAFDGSDDAIHLGDTTVWDGLADLTISAWIKVDASASGINPILCKGTYNTNEQPFHLRFYPGGSGNGRLSFSVERDSDESDGEGGFAYANNLDSLMLGKWANIAVVYSNTNDSFKIYVNGVEKVLFSGSTVWNGTFIDIPSEDAPARIGSDDGTNHFQGNISEIATYNSALTASQVKTIYNGRESYNHKEGIASSNLLTWWRMGDGVNDDPNVDSEGGVIGDEVTPTLGPELWDSTASTFDGGSSTYAWTAYSGTTISNDSNTLKIVKDDDTTGDGENGAYVYLRDSKDLSTDLTVTKMYKLSFDVKVDSGDSVVVMLSEAGGTDNVDAVITHTDFKRYTFYFQAGHATNVYIGAFNMSTGEIVWFDNMSLREIGGYAGAMQNMTPSDFTGDTP